MTFTSWIRRKRAILIRCSKTRLDYLGLLLLLAPLGSLSNHGSDGGKRYFKSEFALSQRELTFKFHRSSISFNFANVEEFFWSGVLSHGI